MLLLQDASSNGTWINGARMTPGRYQQVQPGDRRKESSTATYHVRISFLQPNMPLEDDPATYEALELKIIEVNSHFGATS